MTELPLYTATTPIPTGLPMSRPFPATWVTRQPITHLCAPGREAIVGHDLIVLATDQPYTEKATDWATAHAHYLLRAHLPHLPAPRQVTAAGELLAITVPLTARAGHVLADQVDRFAADLTALAAGQPSLTGLTPASWLPRSGRRPLAGIYLGHAG